MLLNDSFVFVNYYNIGKDFFIKAYKKKIPFGNKIMQHGYYQDVLKLDNYTMVDLDGLPKYLVRQTNCDTAFNWTILPNDKKIILGHECTAALSVNYKNDSTLVWFTSGLKYKRGSLFYPNIPGVVLELYDQRGSNGGFKFIAKSIENVALQLVSPTEGKIIECVEFNKIMKSRNDKMGGNTFIIRKRTL